MPKTDATSLVSVILPTHNAARYILEAVESALKQVYPNKEIIVVDDGSTDNTRDVLASYLDKIVYVSQENRGVSSARNTAIQHARGELIAFLDADDIWLPNKLDTQMRFLANHPKVELLFSDAEIFNSNETIVPSFMSQKMSGPQLNEGEIGTADVSELLLTENFVVTSTVVAKKECVEGLGGFNESLRSVEDRDLWLRVARRYAVGYMSSVLTRKRVHDCNISSDSLLALQSRVKVLEMAVTEWWRKEDKIPPRVRSSLAKAHFSLGYHYFEKGECDEARRSFRKSLGRKMQVRVMGYYVATHLGSPAVIWARKMKQHCRVSVL